MSDKQKEFIKKSVYDGCIKEGVPEQEAGLQAESAIVMYARNQFNGKPLDLIKSQILTAKRISKKKRGSK
tara:strand:- start:314 stop:523 length:210 start_codon:yes stop_codon:yes gene_type:complete